nr:MAG: ORF1ab [Astroviridae sp.]
MSVPWWQRSLILNLPQLCPPMATGGEPQGAADSQPLLSSQSGSSESIPSVSDIKPAIVVLADDSETKRLQTKAAQLEAKIKKLQNQALAKRAQTSIFTTSDEEEEEVFVSPKVSFGVTETKVYNKNTKPVLAGEKGKAVLCGDEDSVDAGALLSNKAGGFADKLRPNQDLTAGASNFTEISLHADSNGPISVSNPNARPRVQVTVSADASKWPVDNGAVHHLVDAITTLSEGTPNRTPLRDMAPRTRTQRFLGLLAKSKWCSCLGWVLLAVALCLGICLGGLLVFVSAQYNYIASLYGPYNIQLQHAQAEAEFCQSSLGVLNESLGNATEELQQQEVYLVSLKANYTLLTKSYEMLQTVLEAHSKHVPISDQALIKAESKIRELSFENQQLRETASLYQSIDTGLKFVRLDDKWWHWLVWGVTCFLMWLLRPTVETLIHMTSLFLTQGQLALFMWTHLLGGWSSFIVLDPLWWIPQFFTFAIFVAWMAFKGRWWYLAWNVLLSIGFNALAFYLDQWGIFVPTGLIHASVMHFAIWLFPVFLKLGLWSQGDLITTHRWTGERSQRHSQNWLQRKLWKAHSDTPPNPQRREPQHEKKIKFVKGETLFKPEADYGQPWVSDEVQKKITPFDVLHPQSQEIYGKAFHMTGLLVTPGHVFDAIGKPPLITVNVDGQTYQTNKVGELRFSGESMVAFQPVPGHKSLQMSKMKGVVMSCLRSRNGTGTWGIATGLTNTNSSTHSCTTQAGDSGSPVCDVYGKLLGVHVGAAPGANLMAQRVTPESRLILCVDCECGCEDGDECVCNQNVGYAKLLEKPKLVTPEAKAGPRGALVNDPCMQNKCRGLEHCFDYSRPPADCKVPPGQVDLCHGCSSEATDDWQKHFSCSAHRCNYVDDPCVVCFCDASVREIMMTRTQDKSEFLDLVQEKGPAGAFKALKNKKKNKQNDRMPRRMFTDEEYDELLALGFSPQEIKKLARERYEFLMDRGHGSNLGNEFDPNQHLVIGKQGIQTRYTGQRYESKEPPKNLPKLPWPKWSGAWREELKGILTPNPEIRHEWGFTGVCAPYQRDPRTKHQTPRAERNLFGVDNGSSHQLPGGRVCSDSEEDAWEQQLTRSQGCTGSCEGVGLSCRDDITCSEDAQRHKGWEDSSLDSLQPIREALHVPSDKGAEEAVLHSSQKVRVSEAVERYVQLAAIDRAYQYSWSPSGRHIPLPEPVGPWNNYVPSSWGAEAYQKTLDKHDFDTPSMPINFDAWREATSYVWEILHRAGNYPLVYSPDKPSDTSPGYPFILKPGMWNPSKGNYATSDQLYKDFPTLFPDISTDIEEGLSPYYYVFLKREQISRQKAMAGDIRAIYVQPDPWARVQAQFDQALNASLKRLCLQIPLAVGFAPFWHTDALVRGLKNPNFYVEKDFKRFDGTIPATLLLWVRLLRWDFLQPQYKTEENWKIFQQLCMSLCYKELIHPSGLVYCISKGNPSGQMSTSIDNCLVNCFVTAYTHFCVYGDLPYSLMTYGDDIVQGYYHPPRPSEEAEVMRYTFGMWLKDDFKVSQTPQGLQFCGFTIHRARGRWIPAYKPDRIIANIWRPVEKDENDFVFWAKLVAATLYLWETPHKEIPYSLLRICFANTDFWIPDASFFENIFWEGGGWTESSGIKFPLGSNPVGPGACAFPRHGALTPWLYQVFLNGAEKTQRTVPFPLSGGELRRVCCQNCHCC